MAREALDERQGLDRGLDLVTLSNIRKGKDPFRSGSLCVTASRPRPLRFLPGPPSSFGLSALFCSVTDETLTHQFSALTPSIGPLPLEACLGPVIGLWWQISSNLGGACAVCCVVCALLTPPQEREECAVP